MEVRPRKNSVSEGCGQCLAKGESEISLCGNTVSLQSPAWEHSVADERAVQWLALEAPFHTTCSHEYRFLLSVFIGS